ncbi:helix-turn-helix transcriptional regulator [Streptomyces sp. B1866]|uniref:helix-turn-helix domain-containing protein n=1 Tax=Streptomyces sp. B1866 TaxID=3075431 RepID=UPI00288DCAFB|nr:helix-turn-helix transcriptional regulator [Streptomyces sp. B1866]MDT3398419.1 helix-turn-helix transcriptional regulator [Streptomyces sp. B1866]
MTHAHVSYGMWAAYGVRASPATVAAWEAGEASPDDAELRALAGALWCAPGDLLGVPTTLREYRVARGMAPSDLALRLGMDPFAYDQMERSGRWTGTDAQARVLAEALGLPPPALLRATGRDVELAGLLRSAVDTRWRAYLRPVARLVPLPRPAVERALRELYGQYQSHLTATLSRGTAADAAAAQARAFLEGIVDRFWAAAGEGAGEGAESGGGDAAAPGGDGRADGPADEA